MVTEEPKRPAEEWYNSKLSPPEQSRLVLGTYDLDNNKLPQLYERLRSLGLTVWDKPEGGYSTLYFWSPVDQDLATRLRARWYRNPTELKNLNSNTIHLDPDQLAILEIKANFPSDKGSETEIKYRQAARLKTIREAANNLLDATDILRATPHQYNPLPTSTIPKEIFKAIWEKHPSGLVPTLMLSASRDHFIVDRDHPDVLRITIDHNYSYHSFWGTPPWEGAPIGGYTPARIEVKVTDDKWLESGRRVLDIIREEGGFLPITRKDGFKTFLEHKYSKTRFPLSESWLRQELIDNEGNEFEMEGKLRVGGEQTDIGTLADSLYKIFDSGAGGFAIQPELKYIKTTSTKHSMYGFPDNNGVLQEGFSFVIQPDKKQFGIKHKGQPIAGHSIQLRRENISERTYLPLSIFNPDMLAKVESKNTGSEAVRVGNFTKSKKRIFIENSKTRRLYIVGVDLEETDKGEKISQIEIEYGRTVAYKIQTSFETSVKGIEADIRKIMDIILASQQKLGIDIQETSQTKFEWLLELYKKPIKPQRRYF